jgi:Periplasmic pectate lyase
MRPTCVPTPRLKASLLALVVGMLALLASGCRVDAPPPVPTVPTPTQPAEVARAAPPVPAPAATPVPTRVATPSPARADYLGIARRYADTMFAHGRDIDGPARSPLFSTTLDRRTLGLLRSAPPLEGVRPEDRAVNAANPMHDQNLYQVLYALSEITGDRRYATAADEALRWFFTHTQSRATGLFAWGEHLGWDLRGERRIVVTGSTSEREAEHLEGLYEHGTHEFYRPWVLWDRGFALAPEAAGRFARGVWKSHVGDHETGPTPGPGRSSRGTAGSTSPPGPRRTRTRGTRPCRGRLRRSSSTSKPTATRTPGC